MGKPTVPEVLPLVAAYRDMPGNGVGGNFHIVLDECNVTDEDVAYCLTRARENGDNAGIHLGELLMRMSKTQRSKLSNMFYSAQRHGRGVNE